MAVRTCFSSRFDFSINGSTYAQFVQNSFFLFVMAVIVVDRRVRNKLDAVSRG